MYKRSAGGRVLDGNVAARSLVAMLPTEHAATQPSWLERLPPPAPRELFPAAAQLHAVPVVHPSFEAERAQLEAERQGLMAMKQQLQALQAQWMQQLGKLATAAVPEAPSAQLVLD